MSSVQESTFLPIVNCSLLIDYKFAIILSRFASIAQSVEQRTENPCVAGSIPARGTVKLEEEW